MSRSGLMQAGPMELVRLDTVRGKLPPSMLTTYRYCVEYSGTLTVDTGILDPDPYPLLYTVQLTLSAVKFVVV
jgi:hypothetical protein